jgi:DNA-binding NarL/FixJ family response regulator
MKAIRTLLVDDQRLFAETLAARLNREPDLEVLAVAHDRKQAVALFHSLSPAVVLLDLILGSANGLTVLDEVRASDPECPVVVLTGVSDGDQVVDAVRRGARAWLPKTVGADQLVQVIRGVVRGESWIPPDLLAYVLRQLTAGQPVAGPDPVAALTARERDVLQCAVDGLSRPEIARRLYLSPNTVRTHTHNLLSKLPAHSMLEAVSLARRHGMRPTGS